MSKQSGHYILFEEPIPYVTQSLNRRLWDDTRADKFRFYMRLQHLHGDRPLFKGNIALTVNFYMRTNPTSKGKQHGYYHVGYPKITPCVQFMEKIITDALCEPNHHIVTLISTKHWNLVPRIDIIIQELDKC